MNLITVLVLFLFLSGCIQKDSDQTDNAWKPQTAEEANILMIVKNSEEGAKIFSKYKEEELKLEIRPAKQLYCVDLQIKATATETVKKEMEKCEEKYLGWTQVLVMDKETYNSGISELVHMSFILSPKKEIVEIYDATKGKYLKKFKEN